MNHQRAVQDPYEILNLPRNASHSQVKSAYRKLALKYHPDKQTTEEQKVACKEKFTEVAEAYEILGDAQRREAFDRYGTTTTGGVEDGNNVYGNGNSQPNRSHQSTHQHAQHDPFGGFFRGSDPFQNAFFTGRGSGSSGGFMDPFEIFSNEFHNDQDYHSASSHSNSQRNNGDFRNFDNGMGSNLGFGNFDRHMNMMNSMMNMQSSFSNNFQQQGCTSSTSYSSSSTSFGYGNGNGNGNQGMQESVSTSTRIINGKRYTVTERVKVHPDGRVEKTTDTSGDDGFPLESLGYNNSNSNGHGNGSRSRSRNRTVIQNSLESQQEPRR